MDKGKIKKAIEQASGKYIAKAIQQEAEIKAYGIVRDAAHYDIDDEGAPKGEYKNDEKDEVLESSVTTLQHNDPRIHKI